MPLFSVAYEVVSDGVPSGAVEGEVVSRLFFVAALASGAVGLAYPEQPASLGSLFCSHLSVT